VSGLGGTCSRKKVSLKASSNLDIHLS
jgi:hypothetical protein